MQKPDPPKPRPKEPSRPDLLSARVDKVVGAAQHHGESLDHVRPELARKGTLPGGVAVPRAPALPLEVAATRPAPSPWAKTVCRPTPPSTVAHARRSEPPEAEPLPPPSQDPDAASREALRRRAEAAEARAAELERRERVREEAASPNTFPPQVQERPKSAGGAGATPSSAPDAAIGRGVRLLLGGRIWPLLIGALGLGGGTVAVARPTTDPAKADAVLASQQAMQADVALLREQVAGMLKREAARDAYVRCLEESLDEVGEQLLPAQDRLHNASPLRAYVKRCQRLRP